MSQSMLQSHTHKVKGTRTLGYLVAVEVDDTAEFAPTSERIALALAGALTWMEGVGPVDVDELGEIETIEPKHDDWGV